MPTWVLRLSTVAIGLAFIAGAMALTVPSVKRGYFEGRHGQHFPRGTPTYNFHCVLMLAVVVGGGAFVCGGLVLSREQLLRGPLNKS